MWNSWDSGRRAVPQGQCGLTMLHMGKHQETAAEASCLELGPTPEETSTVAGRG